MNLSRELTWFIGVALNDPVVDPSRAMAEELDAVDFLQHCRPVFPLGGRFSIEVISVF